MHVYIYIHAYMLYVYMHDIYLQILKTLCARLLQRMRDIGQDLDKSQDRIQDIYCSGAVEGYDNKNLGFIWAVTSMYMPVCMIVFLWMGLSRMSRISKNVASKAGSGIGDVLQNCEEAATWRVLVRKVSWTFFLPFQTAFPSLRAVESINLESRARAAMPKRRAAPKPKAKPAAKAPAAKAPATRATGKQPPAA